MPEMKTLTINGEAYTVSDPDAVLYTAQTLTDEQQAQARENIGAVGVGENQLTVTITATSDTTGTSSHTPKQIFDHVQNGGTVVCYADGTLCQVDNITETGVLFHAGVADLNDSAYIMSFRIDADGNVVVAQNVLLTDETKTELEDRIDAVESDIDDISTALETKITKTLLWRNLSLTSTFKAQKVAVSNLSAYDGYMIVFSSVNAYSGHMLSSGFISAWCNTTLTHVEVPYHFSRPVTYSSTGLTFGNVTTTTLTSGDTALNVSYIIPYEIYGIGGVS